MTRSEPPGAPDTTRPSNPVPAPEGRHFPGFLHLARILRENRRPSATQVGPPAVVRSWRNQAEQEDDGLNYLCELLLARIRLAALEEARRGGEAADSVMRRLAAVLRDHFPSLSEQPSNVDVLDRAVDRLTPFDHTDPTVLSGEQLTETLQALETGLASVRRRQYAVWAEIDEFNRVLRARRGGWSGPLDSPFAVYVAGDDHAAAEELGEAVAALFAAQDIHAAPDGPPVISSWFQRFTLRAKEKLSEPEIATRLAKVEHAIEVAALHDPMSRVNVQQADAMARLLAAAEKCDNFVALAGSIVLVKHTDDTGRCNVYAKTLSVAEVRAFERNQHLLTSPAEALRHLELLSMAGERDQAVQ